MADRPTFKCFILDMDGTVVDTAPDIANAANQTLRDLGMSPLPVRQIAGYIGGGVVKLMERCLAERADELLEQSIPIYTKYYDAKPAVESRLYPGVLAGMQKIKAEGGLIGICTQKPEGFSHRINEQLGIAEYVDCLVGPDSVTHKKPHPEPVLKVLEKLGVDKDTAIFVGDAASDIIAGEAAGVTTCAVTYGYGKPETLLAENPDYTIDAFEQLFDLVRISG